MQFLPVDEQNAQYIADTILNFFESLGISIKDWCEQSYDNASNTSGKYSGVLSRIKEVCEFTIEVPCAAHLLNLEGPTSVYLLFNYFF